jgi:hypothetical protein
MPGFYTGGGGGVTPAEIWGYVDRRLTRAPVLKRLCWSGADGDAIFTPTTATTYRFPRPIMFYRNLVIGSLATLRPPTGARVQVLCVSDTLQLDGVIDVSGLGAPGGSATGGGVGGAGGGGVIVVTRNIVGSGRIQANGLKGGDGVSTGTAGTSGSSGAYKGISIPGGVGGCGVNYGGGGGSGIWGSGGNGGYSGVGNGCAGGRNPKDIRFVVLDHDIYYDGYAGGGGAGHESSTFQNAGGGGGGGGLIIVISDNPVPGITLQARGGDGGRSYFTTLGGGGGGGCGLIIVVAPGDSSTKDVSGGAGGAPYGASGEAGLALYIPVYAYEVI